MRVIDCDCGRTLQAANDDDLHKAARRHFDEHHADKQLSDDQVRELVADKAYVASDSSPGRRRRPARAPRAGAIGREWRAPRRRLDW